LLSHIRTPYADTHAGQLSWRLGVDRVPALAVEVLEVPGGRCELRLLAASHQVIATLDGLDASELVTCGSGAGESMPEAASREFAHLTYRFRSSVVCHDAAGVARAAEGLTATYAEHPHAIVGVYPGSPHAVTAIVAHPGPPLGWSTWHVYPQTGEVVTTDALLARPQDPT